MSKCLICQNEYTLGDVYGICIDCDEWMARTYCNFNQITGKGFSCKNSPGKYFFSYICDNAGASNTRVKMWTGNDRNHFAGEIILDSARKIKIIPNPDIKEKQYARP